MKKNNDLRFVIVGHVDHGKSTLIGRILYDTDSVPKEKIEEIKSVCNSLGKDFEIGFILDNLEEERDQNVTIDTTQIFFKTKKRNYTIIDAPGHVEFLKNMITGASQAEAAILIVDADEGIKEQTKRHSYIIKMLGLNQVIVVINKMDKVSYKKEIFEKTRDEIKAFLSKIGIKTNVFIPISAREGDNVYNKSDKMKWFNHKTVVEALDDLKKMKSNNEKPLRFPVQDVYNHVKRIIVGRVESGIIRAEDDIIIYPSEEKTKIKSIEEFNNPNMKNAESGKAVGVTTKDKVFTDRGNIICRYGERSPHVVSSFKAHLFWFDKEPLSINERILLKISTQEVICQIEKFEKIIDSSTLEPIKRENQINNREVADVIIKTDKQVIVENYNEIQELGRFILERLNTCAGGIITEVD